MGKGTSEQNKPCARMKWYNQGTVYNTGINYNFVSYNMLQLIFYRQVIFVFLWFLGMVMHANEVETKEKQK